MKRAIPPPGKRTMISPSQAPVVPIPKMVPIPCGVVTVWPVENMKVTVYPSST